LLIVVCPTAIAVAAGVLIANAAPLPLSPPPPPLLLPPPLLPQPSYRRRAAAALPPHFPTPSRCHRAATINHFGVGTKYHYHFAHVEPKIPKSSEKGSKRIKAQTLRNARQILDLAIRDKIWPRSQKPKKNKGRHPLRKDFLETSWRLPGDFLETLGFSGCVSC
jgi:hypothetical protein